MKWQDTIGPAVTRQGTTIIYCKGKIRLDVRKKLLMVRVVRHWNRLPGEMADGPDLEVAGKWMVLKVPLNPRHSVFLCVSVFSQDLVCCVCATTAMCAVQNINGWKLSCSEGAGSWTLLVALWCEKCWEISKWGQHCPCPKLQPGGLGIYLAAVGELSRRDQFAGPWNWSSVSSSSSWRTIAAGELLPWNSQPARHFLVAKYTVAKGGTD